MAKARNRVLTMRDTLASLSLPGAIALVDPPAASLEAGDKSPAGQGVASGQGLWEFP